MPWSINGQAFRIDPDFRARLAVDYDRDVATVLAQRVHPGAVCLDVGANVGVYALQFAGWTGAKGRVFAFEPNPQSRAILRRHVSINDLDDRIEIVPMAVGPETGTVEFASCGTDGMSRVGPANPLLASRQELESIAVQCTTLDEFCLRRKIDPDWLFLDIEGHEIGALQGARALVARRGPALQIAVEMHPSAWGAANASRGQLLSLLSEMRRRPYFPDGTKADLDRHATVFLEPLETV